MPWSDYIAPPFSGALVWEDLPEEHTPINAADLNTSENAPATYAAAIGASVVSWVKRQIADPAALATRSDIPVFLPPSGPAGGDLSGTYPNPTVNTIGGQALPVTLPPSGAAGGDLSGSFPNPGVAKVAGNATPTGDLSGSTWAAMQVARIGGRAVSALVFSDDPVLTGAAQKAQNLADLANVDTARTNLKLSKPGRAYRNAVFNFTANTWTVVPLDTADGDVGGMLSGGGLVVPAAGYYDCFGTVFVGTAGNPTLVQAGIGRAAVERMASIVSPQMIAGTSVSVRGRLNCAAGDKIQLWVNSNMTGLSTPPTPPGPAGNNYLEVTRVY